MKKLLIILSATLIVGCSAGMNDGIDKSNENLRLLTAQLVVLTHNMDENINVLTNAIYQANIAGLNETLKGLLEEIKKLEPKKRAEMLSKVDEVLAKLNVKTQNDVLNGLNGGVK